MKVNADFSERVLVHGANLPWVPSPMAGVERRMLDRIGEEVARATSLVRYAPGSHFEAHVHGGGEEFLVLEGVFHDEHGDYPVGTYVRNPPTSRHTPGAEDGCIIFVKLRQFEPTDRTFVRAPSARMHGIQSAERAGACITPLYEDERERVQLERWDPGVTVCFDAPGGAELLVLEGELVESGDELRRWSWLRVPTGGQIDAKAGKDGCSVWIKTGHLRFIGAASA
ncbi:MAG: cupin domain-containing protein [Myxococcota bacterium]